MNPNDRLAQIQPLQMSLATAWPMLEPWLIARKNDLVRELVAVESDQVRGRIKELDNLLGLPERLQQEALSLQYPQEEAELP